MFTAGRMRILADWIERIMEGYGYPGYIQASTTRRTRIDPLPIVDTPYQ